tara:strand:- start:241 stop:432 length:192 start_codon:yes stop_codon:yes gene_type:complete
MGDWKRLYGPRTRFKRLVHQNGQFTWIVARTPEQLVATNEHLEHTLTHHIYEFELSDAEVEEE